MLKLVAALLLTSTLAFVVTMVGAEFFSLSEAVELKEIDNQAITFKLNDLPVTNRLLFNRKNHSNDDLFSYNFTIDTYTDDSIPNSFFGIPVPPNNGFTKLEPIVLFKLSTFDIKESIYPVNLTFYSVLSSGIFNVDSDSYVLNWYNPESKEFEEWNSFGGDYFNYSKNHAYSFAIPVSNIAERSIITEKEFIFSLMGYKRELQTNLNETIVVNSPGNIFIKLDDFFTLQYKVNSMYLGDPIVFKMDQQNVLPLIPPTSYVVLVAIGYYHFSGAFPYIRNNWYLLKSLNQTVFTDYSGNVVDIDIISDPTYWITGEEQTNLAIVAKLKSPPLPSDSTNKHVVYLYENEEYPLTAKQNVTYYFSTQSEDFYDVYLFIKQNEGDSLEKITVYLKLNQIPTIVDYDAIFETSTSLERIKVDIGEGKVYIAIISSYKDTELTIHVTKPLKERVPVWIVGPIIGGVFLLSLIIGITILAVSLRKRKQYQVV
ncbi:hypothetical protein ABK040_010906 [Willaertia magna]